MNTTDTLIPRPSHVALLDDPAFTLASTARISAIDSTVPVAEQLASLLRGATGFALPIVEDARPGDISLELAEAFDGGPEAYVLIVAESGVGVTASTPAGLFYGVQTLRQLFPAAIESGSRSHSAGSGADGAWVIPAVEIADAPRFAYRGLMLDVARSFFTVDQVKEQIDVMTQFKLNALHLHLTDDQAWRIEIHEPAENPSALPYANLTGVGGQGAVEVSTAIPVRGHEGFYTQQDFLDIQAYAAGKNVLVVPEIDLPGHVNAALAAIPQLNPDGKAKPMSTTAEVGWSTLTENLSATYEFAREVLGQLAAITVGPYLHVGGDEAKVTEHDHYVSMVQQFVRIGAETGKTVVGWNEFAAVELPEGAVIQYWHGDFEAVARQAERHGAKVLMSPADKTYLDQKYAPDSPIGLEWVEGGPFDWADYYNWDPAQGGLKDHHILGVEGALWSETVRDNQQAQWLLYPRAVSLAEVAWSGQEVRNPGDFRRRLGALGERLAKQGVAFQEAPDVEWSAVSQWPFPEAETSSPPKYGTIEA
ncbi:beta-N-acetylhexosaminidase [Arthrobacter sp. TS-15]|uniref:beta-N-acetylhexosaminidase n=1 Tax=Micrococcaceae TaxID=1268 RepID=UPI00115DE07F|nr:MULTISPECIES: beta-N-acetylhexosaminidase [Micrococcaceae]MCM0618614.1 beta-N-acetylhexosaminidase [Paenarthrobacter sp. TYUT067]TQS94440.1 beta-N-acetylhexosaminidase [Arthrobacter sp. TS-15]